MLNIAKFMVLPNHQFVKISNKINKKSFVGVDKHNSGMATSGTIFDKVPNIANPEIKYARKQP